MADIIKLLPDSVANQIAAGEVIQRPASLVKELMENSVDAGASNISVIIKDSGRTLVRVSDDGTGMSETDARLAFERHATSKITTARDLFAITTKGFRGEALASIAAVAMVELKTRLRDNETGTLIQINGSKVESQEPCSCPAGTSFSVKNLFYNIPARRKFLKSDNTEMRHIVNEFQKIALAHPGIRFSLYNNDNEIYNLTEGNLRQRIAGVFGKQMNQELITIDTQTTLVTIRGFIGKPENARRTYGEQFFFINNRFMKHPYFHKAVSEAYQNILPADAIPSYFIFMEADPASIDVNIHPTKTEIKFEEERSIWQILMASVREALGRFSIIPSIDFENEALVDIPVIPPASVMPEMPSIKVNPSFNPFESEATGSRYSGSAERFERGNVTGWEKLYPPDEQYGEVNPRQDMKAEHTRKILHVKGKFIVCPVISGLMIIDQKRAHERILFERYLEILIGRQSVSQSELFPVTKDINPADLLIVKEIEKELNILGFRFIFPGSKSITITGRPPGTEDSDPGEILEILIENYKNSMSDPSAGVSENVAASLAAAAAIPYGKSISQEEMENLFDMLFACKAPNYSPRGKPVISILTLDEIDKRFKQ